MRNEYDIYPVELIKTGLNLLRLTNLKKNIHSEDPRRYLMLYCLEKMNDEYFLPLNRNYKPIGLEKGFANYNDYSYLFIPKERIKLKNLWKNGIDGNYFTFADSTYPDEPKYLKRYEKIINSIFFTSEDEESFEYFWGYKEKLDPKGYNENLNRFKP
jgi:hypothetical protein